MQSGNLKAHFQTMLLNKTINFNKTYIFSKDIFEHRVKNDKQ